MSAEWTAERLDALPEGTVIEWLIPAANPLTFFTKDSGGNPDRPWAYSRGGRESSESITLQLAPVAGESLRIVSVPIDALLSEGAQRAAAEAQPLPKPYLLDSRGLRAAIAHVTGEQPQ